MTLEIVKGHSALKRCYKGADGSIWWSRAKCLDTKLKYAIFHSPSHDIRASPLKSCFAKPIQVTVQPADKCCVLIFI